MKQISSILILGLSLLACTTSMQAQTLVSLSETPVGRTTKAEVLARMIIETDSTSHNPEELLAKLGADLSVEINREKLTEFYDKHCRLGTMAAEITAMLAARFTDDELDEITSFYRTDAGAKVLQEQYCALEARDLREMSEFFSGTKGGRAVLKSWFPKTIREMREKNIEDNILELLDAFELDADAGLLKDDSHES
ncbi:MAG: DUF2059 domain-containing protein [Bacteroidota bacterium]|jgi:hypothetical protein